MSEVVNNTPEYQNEYGYTSDEVKSSPFNFGLNAAHTYLTKFEWIPNGGKEGAEQEAIDIIFNINGVDKSYRLFPIVKAFGKNNVEITDRNAPEFKDALADLNAKITHILHCFVEYDSIKAKFSRPIKSFKEFAQLAASILPPDFKTKPLDIFLQYQWTLKDDQKRTYLDIPGKMKYGKFLCAAQPGKWEKVEMENPTENDGQALYYKNEEGTIHPFVKNGWFMTSNFAKQQKAAGVTDDEAKPQDQATAEASEQMNSGEATAANASIW